MKLMQDNVGLLYGKVMYIYGVVSTEHDFTHLSWKEVEDKSMKILDDWLNEAQYRGVDLEGYAYETWCYHAQERIIKEEMQMQMKALSQFRDAFLNLYDVYEGDFISLDDLKNTNEYPFDQSLDEVVYKVSDWTNSSIDELYKRIKEGMN